MQDVAIQSAIQKIIHGYGCGWHLKKGFSNVFQLHLRNQGHIQDFWDTPPNHLEKALFGSKKQLRSTRVVEGPPTHSSIGDTMSKAVRIVAKV